MRILIDIVVMAVLCITGWFLYQNYWDEVERGLFGAEPTYTIYLGAKALEVSVADEQSERILGLSGVRSLRESRGKLFIFDAEGNHGIWMKEMKFPLDIIWIDNNLEVVHIEGNVAPESFPEVFESPSPARFVLEVNAYFADLAKIQLGDRLLLPPGILPTDISKDLQQ